jgi:hypothetical protein
MTFHFFSRKAAKTQDTKKNYKISLRLCGFA